MFQVRARNVRDKSRYMFVSTFKSLVSLNIQLKTLLSCSQCQHTCSKAAAVLGAFRLSAKTK